jgi:hypothetical protein
MNKDTVGFDYEKLPPGQLEESSTSGEQTGVRESRRRFSRLGIGAAPIVISLVSKPVLGAQCLSNMLSGNLSDPNRGNCRLGTSPGGWGNPGGSINGVRDTQAWTQAGFTYGDYKTSCGHRNQARCYDSGSTVASLPAGLMTSSPSTKTLREVLLDEGSHNRDRHVLAAWLNAKFSENSGGTFTYILTTAQVIALANGSIPLPQPYLDLSTFLDSTWT